MAIKIDEKEDKNPIQQKYNQKLNSHGGASRSSEDLASPEHQEKSGINPKDSVDLGSSEKKATEVSGDDANPLNYKPDSSSKASLSKKMLARGAYALSGRKKYGWVGGGVIGLIITLLISSIPALGPGTMMNGLDGFHFAPNRSSRTIRNTRFVKRILTGKPLTVKGAVSERIKGINSAELETHLEKRGVRVELDPQGKPKGLIDIETGKNTRFNSNKGLSILDDALPSVEASERGLARTFAKIKANLNYTSRFIDIPEGETFWSNARRLRAGGADFDGARKSVIDEDPKTSNLVDEGVNDAAKTGNAAFDESTKSAGSSIAAGETDSIALRNSVKENSLFKRISPKSIAVGTFVVSCVVKSIYDNDLQAKYYKYSAGLAEATEAFQVWNEVQNGNPETAESVGQFMDKYNNSTGSFANSSAWAKINGLPSNAPGLNIENDISGQYGADDIMGEILGAAGAAGGLVNRTPLLSQACGAFNAVAGTVIGALALQAFDITVSAIEIVAACNPLSDAATVGTTCAGKIGVQAFFFTILPRIIAMALNSATAFTINNPEQAFNFLSQATAVLSSETYRTGTPVSEAEYTAMVDDYYKEQMKDASLFEKYFASDNVRSVTNYLATMKTSFATKTLQDKVTYLASFPLQLLGTIKTMFTKPVFAEPNETRTLGYVDPHSTIQRYSMNNKYLYMDELVIETKAKTLLENSEEAVLTARYCMGYDYQTDSVSPEYQLPLFSNPGPVDSEKGGLSGFFDDLIANSFRSPNAQRDNQRVQDYCINFANGKNNKGQGITIDQYSLIGRYVDDINIMDGMTALLSPSQPASYTTAIISGPSLSANGTTQELAQQILNIADTTGRIEFLFSSRQNTFEPLAAGNLAKITDPDGISYRSSGLTDVSPELLRIIIDTVNSNVVPVLKVGSVTSGSHSNKSRHFLGQAVDIKLTGLTSGQRSGLFKYYYDNSQYGGGNFCIGSLISNPPAPGTSTLFTGKPRTFSADILKDHKTHIHLSVTTYTIRGCEGVL